MEMCIRDRYNYLLLLMVEVTKQANKRLNAAKNKLVPTKEELFPNTKFVENLSLIHI